MDDYKELLKAYMKVVLSHTGSSFVLEFTTDATVSKQSVLAFFKLYNEVIAEVSDK